MRKIFKLKVAAMATLTMLISTQSLFATETASEFEEEDEYIYEDMVAGTGIIGVGFGASILMAGSADALFEKTADTPKYGKIDYNNKVGFAGLVEGGYIVNDKFIIEANLGFRRNASVFEKSKNDALFTLSTFLANIQAKIALSSFNASTYIPYAAFGFEFDYNKMDFGVMGSVISDATTGLTIDSVKAHEVIKGAPNAYNFSALGSAGVIIKSDGGFMFDIGYTGNIALTGAEIKTGVFTSSVKILPVNHSVLCKLRMVA